MVKPAALAHEAIHETVARLFDGLPRGRVLDVPSGEGALAVRLSELGFEVSCCDLYPQIFKLENVENKQGNLDSVLPYEDLEFDSVVCVEGLEHIENPANAFREFDRLLKPDGTLVVSVPNIMNIEERLRWLFSGYTSHFKPLSTTVRDRISKEFAGMDEIALHVNPIGYSEVRYLIEKNGFELQSVFPDKAKGNMWAFVPIAGLIRLTSRLTPARKRQERWADELSSNEVLLGGNTLIFKAKKL